MPKDNKNKIELKDICLRDTTAKQIGLGVSEPGSTNVMNRVRNPLTALNISSKKGVSYKFILEDLIDYLGQELT